MSSNHTSFDPLIAPTRRANIVLYAAFIATGVGLVLPGTLLPLLLPRWSMNDGQAGLLFFLFSAGSMAGALMARGSLQRSVALGCGICALAVFAMSSAAHVTAFAATAIFGCGLGLMMTSISLLQSRWHPTARVAQMTRLNLAWACGACVAPSVELSGAAHFGTPATLHALATVFVALTALTLVAVHEDRSEPPTLTASKNDNPSQVSPRFPPLALLLMVPLATGVESAVGGWLSTYSKRSGQSISGIVVETTCFWAGLLLSRVLLSNHRVAAKLSRTLLWLSPGLIVISLTLLIGGDAHTLTLAAAFLLGLSCGPLYPLLIARVLARGKGNNVIFVVAGIGSSTLPLLTGIVSGRLHSLRFGLGVPLTAALLMMLCGGLVYRAAMLEPSQQP